MKQSLQQVIEILKRLQEKSSARPNQYCNMAASHEGVHDQRAGKFNWLLNDIFNIIFDQKKEGGVFPDELVQKKKALIY